MRLAVGLSGGADSVALLRALASRAAELGLVLHAAHLHHGLRGEEAGADLAFCRDLALSLEIPFHHAQVDTAAEARPNPAIGKPAESIEEAARRLRYSWFRELLSKTPAHAVALDAVATAHTLDDQAETVLAKILRGAWTEGLSGIHPSLESPDGPILRPLLATTHAEVEAFLKASGQCWREDSTNRNRTFTRNRIRHELLPQLEQWNPQIRGHLAQMATLARDEESWWQTELARVAPQILLAGRPVRGGGRAASDGLAIDVTRLSALAPALQRRLLRYAANQLGTAPDFAATEAVLALAQTGRAGQRMELAGCIRAERTPRELRLTVQPATGPAQAAYPEYTVQIPGEIEAPAFNLRLRIDRTEPVQTPAPPQVVPPRVVPPQRSQVVATLRNWRPGDRVKLRHSSAPRKVKEVLERLRVTGSARALWPVLEIENRIVWMRGADLEPVPGFNVQIIPIPHPEAASP